MTEIVYQIETQIFHFVNLFKFGTVHLLQKNNTLCFVAVLVLVLVLHCFSFRKSPECTTLSNVFLA